MVKLTPTQVSRIAFKAHTAIAGVLQIAPDGLSEIGAEATNAILAASIEAHGLSPDHVTEADWDRLADEAFDLAADLTHSCVARAYAESRVAVVH